VWKQVASRAEQSRAEQSAYHLLSCCYLSRLILRPWIWKQYIPPKRQLSFKGPHGFCVPKDSILREEDYLEYEMRTSTNNPAFFPLVHELSRARTLKQKGMLHCRRVQQFNFSARVLFYENPGENGHLLYFWNRGNVNGVLTTCLRNSSNHMLNP
jgi:hypothetical protein